MADIPRATHPFHFWTGLDLTLLTNRRARTLSELLQHLREVPGSVLYYHTHHFLAQHQALSPEPPNDFAYWVTNVLQEQRIGEQLAAVDIIQYRSLDALQQRLIAIIEHNLETRGGERVAPPGQEFHFREAVTVVVQTGLVAHNLADLADCLEQLGFGSLVFHIFAARLRLERGDNDISEWLATELGEQALARQISALDPYTHTFDSLRRLIAQLCRRRLQELGA
jgi:hypothetical protein